MIAVQNCTAVFPRCCAVSHSFRRADVQDSKRKASSMRCVHSVRRRRIVRKKTFVAGSCLGFLLLVGFQSPAVRGQSSQQEPDKVNPCLESTCRNAPLRETLTAIDLRTRYGNT